MKLFVSALILASNVDAQEERGFGALSELGLDELVFNDGFDSLAYDDSNYSLDGADYNSEFTGPSSSGEKRRPNKNKNTFEEVAVEDSSVAFGDGGNDYGVEDISFGDYGGFEDYGGFNSVEAAPAAPAAAAAVSSGRPSANAAPSNGKQFSAPTFGGVNDGDDGTAATRSCLTCLITDLSQAGSCAPQACVEANTVGFAEEDTRDYCLIEIRQTNGAFDQLEMRCATAHDCVSGFLDNVNGVDPKRTDQCRPGKDDNGVATQHFTGRWGHRQSVCRNCAVMSNGANSNGAYNIEVTGAGVFMYDKNSAAVSDVSANNNVLDWSREMWHNAANLAFLKQDA